MSSEICTKSGAAILQEEFNMCIFRKVRFEALSQLHKHSSRLCQGRRDRTAMAGTRRRCSNYLQFEQQATQRQRPGPAVRACRAESRRASNGIPARGTLPTGSQPQPLFCSARRHHTRLRRARGSGEIQKFSIVHKRRGTSPGQKGTNQDAKQNSIHLQNLQHPLAV